MKHIPDLIIISGLAIGLAGAYLMWGVGLCMVIAGVVITLYGALADARWH